MLYAVDGPVYCGRLSIRQPQAIPMNPATLSVSPPLDLGPGTKPIVGMAHLRPLPGSPGYDRTGGMERIVREVAGDIEALQQGGVDAVLFGNEGDRPYVLKAPPEGIAAFAAAVTAVRPTIRVPFGVNYLWDPVATVALAAATGAAFAREVFTGAYAADMGLWVPDAAQALRLRSQLGRNDLKLLFNVNAEFAAALDTRPTERRAKSAVFSSLADAICVSGPSTGEPVDRSELKRVKDAVGATPVLANTGVNLDNVEEILATADGCVVGTHFKIDGHTWNAVDPGRVARFMDKVHDLRRRG
jgi:membrane complex biogenesis BtpA family protein